MSEEINHLLNDGICNVTFITQDPKQPFKAR